MAYQFVHIQTYCPKLTKVTGTEDQYNSTEQVFGEAERDPRYSGHVGDERSILEFDRFGAISIAELRQLHDERRAAIRETVQQKDGGHYVRSLKSDFPTVYTEIHSHPTTVEEYNDAPVEDRARVDSWIAAAVTDFRKRMPPSVKYSVVMHFDEEHIHFHILAINLDDPKLSANKLHVGKVAAEEWRQEHGNAETLEGLPRPQALDRPNKPKQPKPSKNRVTQGKRAAEHAAAIAAWEKECARIEAANEAAMADWKVENNTFLRAARKDRKAKVDDVAVYEAAMVAFQDRYHEAVGKPCGLLRVGPRAERLPTKQYADRKKQARVLAEQAAMLTCTAQELQAQKAVLDNRERTLTWRAEEIEEEGEALAVAEKALACREAAVAERQVATQAYEAALAGREDSIKKQEYGLGQRLEAHADREAVQDREMTAIEMERNDLERERDTFNQDIIHRTAELDARARAVAAAESEVSNAVAVIGDLVGQMEKGEIIAHGGEIRLSRIPDLLRHMLGVAPASRTPVQMLVTRFVDLLRRAVTAIGGGPEVKPAVPDDRPGM